MIASVEVYWLPLEAHAAFLQGFHDFSRGRLFIIVGYDQGVLLWCVEPHNAVCLLEDRTYPRPRTSGLAFRDGQLHGFFRCQDCLLGAREPRHETHQQDNK